MSSAPQTEAYEPERHAFCQVCGRAVANEADRLAGKAFPCGLCNEVKLAAPASTGYVYPGPEASAGTRGAPGGTPFPTAGLPFAPPPVRSDAPNPVLAGLLGVIPGVGAMYNGQYAKGIVHLIVFAILVNLAGSNGLFGLFVAGWIVYQAIEAHHTARARRDGTLLPNPFGLNDIGERLGFGKAWPQSPAGPVSPPAGAGNAASAGQPMGAVQDAPAQAGGPNWGAPWESYRAGVPPVPPFTPPPVPPYGAAYAPVDSGAGWQGTAPFNPQAPGFEPLYPVRNDRFPAGAIWLIALGTLFLLNTSGLFRGLSFRLVLPFLFIGMGIWQFFHSMTRWGQGIADDGSGGYNLRVFRAARGSVWLILVGVIFFLAEYDILSWGRSWPLFLILAGVMTFFERAVYRDAGTATYPGPGATGAGSGGPTSAAGPTGGTPVTSTEPASTTTFPEAR